MHNTITARSGPTGAEWARIAQCLAGSAKQVLLSSRSIAVKTSAPITRGSEPGVFQTILRKANKWWPKIGAFLGSSGHDETSRNLIMRMLRKRRSKQFALPAGERIRLDSFNYHWWSPVIAPGKIKPGLVIPWHRPEVFGYQQQSNAFNRSWDEGALRESAWQRRRAIAQHVSLAFARAPRFRMPTPFAPAGPRAAIGSCLQSSAKKPARSLKRMPPAPTDRRGTKAPRERQMIGP